MARRPSTRVIKKKKKKKKEGCSIFLEERRKKGRCLGTRISLLPLPKGAATHTGEKKSRDSKGEETT